MQAAERAAQKEKSTWKRPTSKLSSRWPDPQGLPGRVELHAVFVFVPNLLCWFSPSNLRIILHSFHPRDGLSEYALVVEARTPHLIQPPELSGVIPTLQGSNALQYIWVVLLPSDLMYYRPCSSCISRRDTQGGTGWHV